ncbi:MAG: hypothetical protein ACPG49_07580 [Chitinophagales bacterium]
MNYLLRFFLIGIILFALPSNVEAQSSWKDIFITKKKRKQEAAEKKAAEVEKKRKIPTETEGITSAVHEKHKNSIVFSNKPIKKRREVEADLITETDILKPIYFRVYMDDCLHNYVIKKEKELEKLSPSDVKKNSSYQIILSLDGEEVIKEKIKSSVLRKFDGLRTRWMTFQDAFGTVNKKVKHDFLHIYRFQRFLTKTQFKLTPGKHDLTVKIIPYYSAGRFDGISDVLTEQSFEGTLTLNVEDKIADPSNTQLCLPSGELNEDKELLEEARVLYKSRMGVLKQDLTISTNGWEINRHKDTGIILDRWFRVRAGGENEDGCFYKTHIFTQDYDGSGYGKLYIEKSYNEENSIPCDCLVDEY